MFKISTDALGLWRNLGFRGIDMPWFEANKAKDVKELFGLGLVKFVRSNMADPAIKVALTAKGWSWKFFRTLFFFLY